ncbi:cache domain-containing protein [Rheinheimera sp. 1928-s]|uniref:cache domain-containing protein n=1 Tax=Rheinheimera sp. 1928-s TaxID=3033803 RepID=UPI00261C6A2E|nr:cache domain-containing protein [Rheinheimera sp. 1928-s]MDF3126760.1 cache domain-containing protein [Rheinheimera sp. 1928-s]
MQFFFEHHKNHLKPHMSGVLQYEQKLTELDSWWSKVSLIGKINSLRLGSTILDNMDQTKKRFTELQQILIDNLLLEQTKKTLLTDKACSQIAIDVLIRNLFERTADIGFLATDSQIRDFLAAPAAGSTDAMQQHLASYVSYYSVYQDVVLLSPDGQILLRLDQSYTQNYSRDPLVQHCLQQPRNFSETFRYSDLQPNQKQSLIYAQAVVSDQGEALGVLCLCFKFEDEIINIFKNLIPEHSQSILLLQADDGSTVFSSDPDSLPPQQTSGRQQKLGLRKVDNRDYLLSFAQTQGYQGYFGPAWQTQIWTPLHSFSAQATSTQQVLDIDNLTLFPELFQIHRSSLQVNEELSLIVLNGVISAARNDAVEFVPVLDAIRGIGKEIHQVFSHSVEELAHTVLHSQLEELMMLARQALDIMDRNLYERANDCRWWAHNKKFQLLLQNPDAKKQQEAAEELAYINDLYTVYSNIYIYDAKQTILCGAREHQTELKQMPEQSGAAQCLLLDSPHHYAVSAFVPSLLYQQQSTYIYHAPVFTDATTGKAQGGIALIFDSAPQFSAMLLDILPKNEQGEIKADFSACFIDEKGAILSSSHTQLWPVGHCVPLPDELFRSAQQQPVSQRVIVKGQAYWLALAYSKGYREYKTCDGYVNPLYCCVLLQC